MTGFICLYKPEGITSFGAVAKVRGITGEKKVGHLGTLDPMATGVLPVMLGGATRFLEFVPDSNKSYTAVMRLGITTDTLDITGEVLETKPVEVSFDDVKCAAEKFKGDILQVPPMYSAIKKDGVKLYKLARAGVSVQRDPRPVTVYRLDLRNESECFGTPLCENEYILDVDCSSGTYIRTLIDDIGKELGCGAVMTKLVRTSAAGFTLSDSVTISQLQSLKDADKIDELHSYVLSVEHILSSYPEVSVTDGQAHRFKNGGSLSLSKLKGIDKDGLYRIKSAAGDFLGLGEADISDNILKFRRVYNER